MTLVCEACESHRLSLTAETHTKGSAHEAYECDNCGGTGRLWYDDVTGARLEGCIARDFHYDPYPTTKFDP